MRYNVFAILILVIANRVPTVLGFDDPTSGDHANVAFHKEVLPFIVKNCFSCHGNGESKADLALDKYKDDLSLLKDRKVWDNVVNMLETHEMPPKEKPQPPADEIERAVKAIESILATRSTV